MTKSEKYLMNSIKFFLMPLVLCIVTVVIISHYDKPLADKCMFFVAPFLFVSIFRFMIYKAKYECADEFYEGDTVSFKGERKFIIFVERPHESGYDCKYYMGSYINSFTLRKEAETEGESQLISCRMLLSEKYDNHNNYPL